jgi:DNA-binding winged helix-turn-helix (wHTH) protein
MEDFPMVTREGDVDRYSPPACASCRQAIPACDMASAPCPLRRQMDFRTGCGPKQHPRPLCGVDGIASNDCSKELIAPMQARSGNDRILRLETFSGRLFVDDQEIALSPKSAQILDCLIQRRGVIVSRKQIFAEAWPSQVVTDAALTQAISLLRRELGNAHKDCIRTIPRRGYVFDLKAINSGPDTEGAFVMHGEVFPAISHDEKAFGLIPGKSESGHRHLSYLLLPLLLVACAGTFAFVRSYHGTLQPSGQYAFIVSENAKTGLASDVATLLHVDVNPTPPIGPRCEWRTNTSTSPQSVLLLDTTGFYANPLNEIPFSICVWNGEKMDISVGKSTISALYSTLDDRLHIARAGRFGASVVSEKNLPLELISEYSAARELAISGLFFKAARQYEAAFLKHPERAQIAMDYAETLAMISETTKARLVYGSVMSSPYSSAMHRSLAAAALAEVEGRFEDAAVQLENLPVDDKLAVRLFDNYFKSSDFDKAKAFVGATRKKHISVDTRQYFNARMLAWNGQRQASNKSLSGLLVTADENLYPEVLWAMISNYYRMFSDNPDRKSLDLARSFLKDLEIFYSRKQNYADQMLVRQKTLIMELSLRDACMLYTQSEVLLRQARQTGAPLLTARALQVRSWVSYRCGDLKRSEQDIVDALSIVKSLSDIRLTAVMRIDYAFILMSGQRLDEAKSQLVIVRLLKAEDIIGDSLNAAESRIERLSGNQTQAKHPCDAMLATLNDSTRRSLLAKCVGVNEIAIRSPDPYRFHGFMQSLHGMLVATQCREHRCVLPKAKSWADEIRAGEPTPRRMMLEDFIFACASLPGMCDSPEIRTVMNAHVSRWQFGTLLFTGHPPNVIP